MKLVFFKSYNFLEDIFKEEDLQKSLKVHSYPVGTVRSWGGQKYIKTKAGGSSIGGNWRPLKHKELVEKGKKHQKEIEKKPYIIGEKKQAEKQKKEERRIEKETTKTEYKKSKRKGYQFKINKMDWKDVEKLKEDRAYQNDFIKDNQAFIHDSYKYASKGLEFAEKKQSASLKKLSVKEFLRLRKIKSNVQRILLIGYYLEKHNGEASFNSKDLQSAFRGAKEPLPTNMNAFINQNIKNGHIMEEPEKKDNKKAFVLTNTGEEYDENILNNKNKGK